MKNFKIAVCQNKPVRDKDSSISHAVKMVGEAAGNGAELVVLPEIFYHPYELGKIPELEEDDHDTLSHLIECTRKNNIHLCTGSTVEKVDGKRYNKSFLIGPDGKILLDYCKCHLYDVNFKGLRTSESATFSYGDHVGVADTELGKIGIIICYDIRFPEMARKLALLGAEIILVPAAFNTISGPAHWDIMFRARAIENQVYLAAASPARDNQAKYKAYGHSMVIDPWGNVLNEAGTAEELIYADCSEEVLENIRGKLPLLKHRRPELY